MSRRNGEGPGTASTMSEAQKRTTLGKRASSSRAPKSSPVRFAVTIGRDQIGTVELTAGGIYIATDTSGHIIGGFESMTAAARALPSSEGAP